MLKDLGARSTRIFRGDHPGDANHGPPSARVLGESSVPQAFHFRSCPGVQGLRKEDPRGVTSWPDPATPRTSVGDSSPQTTTSSRAIFDRLERDYMYRNTGAIPHARARRDPPPGLGPLGEGRRRLDHDALLNVVPHTDRVLLREISHGRQRLPRRPQRLRTPMQGVPISTPVLGCGDSRAVLAVDCPMPRQLP